MEHGGRGSSTRRRRHPLLIGGADQNARFGSGEDTLSISRVEPSHIAAAISAGLSI